MKTLSELEQAIRDMIEQLYEAKYTGMFKLNEIIENDIIIGYTISLGLNVQEQPLRISLEGSDEDFLIFIKKELSSRGLNLVDYYIGEKLYNTNKNE